MDSRVEQIFMMNASKFPTECLPDIRKRLETCDPDTALAMMTRMKDPTLSIIFSVLLGFFGVDRFYIGDNGMGIGKLLTCGGCYVWFIIDSFLIMDATREKNYELFNMYCR